MTDQQIRDHARLAPSAASRWMNCPGSIKLIDGLPAKELAGESEYSAEGTRGHAIAARLLTTGGPLNDDITEDLAEAIQLYVANVLSAQSILGGRLLVEAKVKLSDMVWGTVDAALITPDHVHVFDLKLGKGVLVEADHNEQLLIYALALARQYFKTVGTLHIVQPRAYHEDGLIRTWAPSYDDIKLFEAELGAAIDSTRHGDAPLCAGDWCRFCPAAGHCPALAAKSTAVAKAVFGNQPIVEPEAVVDSLPIEDVVRILEDAPAMELLLRALYARVERALLDRQPAPGWKMVQKRPTRQWVSEAELVEWAEGNAMEQEIYSKVVKSPAQLEKIVGKAGMPNELIELRSGGVTLAPESDKRPAAVLGPAGAFTALPPGDEQGPNSTTVKE